MASKDPITFVLGTERGHRITADLVPGSGGEFRFAVGEPGRHATDWKIWMKRKRRDVYVASRAIGGSQKISLHPTKDGKEWFFQWTKEHMEADPQVPHVDERKIDRWLNPPEGDETGWVTGLSIWTRHQDVVFTPDDESLPDDLLWLPRPPKGYATAVHIVIAQPKNVVVEVKGGLPIAAFALPDGQVVLVIESHVLVTDQRTPKSKTS
jgi:hypothetical protein